MIQSVLVINDSGHCRLQQFYNTAVFKVPEMRTKFVRHVFSLLQRRAENMCNFCDLTPPSDSELSVPEGWKIVYRHYATLFFIFVVDDLESELGILDLIQVFVECLDRLFQSVRELDLIYHPDQINYVLNEMIIGGMVCETRIETILANAGG
eukprot:Partr_v1_DN28382_c3_g1_i12_m78689 putative adaptor-related protein complex 3 sigma